MANRFESNRRAIEDQFTSHESVKLPLLTDLEPVITAPDRDILESLIEDKNRGKPTKHALFDNHWEQINPSGISRMVEDNYSEESFP